MEQVTNTFMMVVPEIHGVFVDSVLTDQASNLLFCSFWGNDTSIRDLQARFTLANAEGGLTAFNITGNDAQGKPLKTFVQLGNIANIGQMTGRVHTDILGDMVHCWLYNNEIMKPDLANHRALLINQDGQPNNLWNAIKLVCPVPLLDHWQDLITTAMIDADMITPLSGINQYGVQINIDEEAIAMIVKEACMDGSLSISDMRIVA